MYHSSTPCTVVPLPHFFTTTTIKPMPQQADTPLYQPKCPQATPTHRFLNSVNHAYSLNLSNYHDLYTWSTHNIDKFWSLVWDFTNIIGHKGDHVVDNSALPAATPAWSASPFYASCGAWRLLMHVSGSKMRVSTGQRTCCTAILALKRPSFKPVSHSVIPSLWLVSTFTSCRHS